MECIVHRDGGRTPNWENLFSSFLAHLTKSRKQDQNLSKDMTHEEVAAMTWIKQKGVL
jgi:hypothetical protein